MALTAQEPITYQERGAQKAPGYRAPHTAAPQQTPTHQRGQRNNQRNVRSQNRARYGSPFFFGGAYG
jgi:hypothetical protein